MRIMTCNVRTSRAWDESNNWEHRSGICIDVIESRRPDIICCQEAQREQLDDILARLGSEYEWHAAADEPGTRAPMNPLLFRKTAFERIAEGAFWLSETPHVAGSRSWDSHCTRYAAWLRLVERETDQEFAVFNTHLDHKGAEARMNQARVLNEAALVYEADYPRLLTGDMNAGPGTPPIEAFRRAGWADAWELVHGKRSPGGTYHGYKGEEQTAERGPIDWIMTMGAIRPSAAEVVRDSHEGRYPSDHYFLSVDVDFLPQEQ